MRILESIETGGQGPLVFILGREPFPLYPLLAAAGWRHSVRRLDAGFELTIARNQSNP